MFSNWKRSAAKTAVVGAVAMSVAGGISLQQAAPAEALIFLAPLAPVIGASVGGITASGWAAVAGGAAAIGAGMHFTSPEGLDQIDAAIDWLMEPVDLFGRPINKDTGEELDDAKEITTVEEVPWVNTECTHPDCFKEPWVNSLWYYRTSDFSTITNANGQVGARIQVTLKGQNQMSGGSEWPAAMATMTCKHPTSGAVLIKPRTLVSLTPYNVAFDSSNQNLANDFYCSQSEGQLQHIMFEPATREEYTSKFGTSNVGPKYDNGGPGATVTFTPTGAGELDGKIRTTVVCRSMSGTETTITADSPTSAPSLTIPSCASRGLGEPVSITSGFYQGETKMKDIFTGSGANSGAVLQVYVDGAPCQIGWEACESWAGLSVVSPERVKCYLGGAEVELERCSYLEGAYLVGGTPATKTNIDGNPATWTPPNTIPGWVPVEKTTDGTVRENPDLTPSPAPSTNPDPNIQPSPRPSPSPSPSPSTSGSPGTGTGTGTGGLPSSGTNPGFIEGPMGENCFGAKWSWNPIDWVVTPVACVLEWAFIPSADVVNATIATTRPTIDNKGIGPLVDVVSTTVTSLPQGGAGCLGPGIDLSLLHQPDMWHPFQACTPPMDGVAFIVRTVFSLVIVFAGCFSVVNALGRAFGYTIPDSKAVMDV